MNEFIFVYAYPFTYGQTCLPSPMHFPPPSPATLLGVYRILRRRRRICRLSPRLYRKLYANVGGLWCCLRATHKTGQLAGGSFWPGQQANSCWCSWSWVQLAAAVYDYDDDSAGTCGPVNVFINCKEIGH